MKFDVILSRKLVKVGNLLSSFERNHIATQPEAVCVEPNQTSKAQRSWSPECDPLPESSLPVMKNVLPDLIPQ